MVKDDHVEFQSYNYEHFPSSHSLIFSFPGLIPNWHLILKLSFYSITIKIKMHLPTFLTLLPFLAFSTAKPHPFVTRQTTTTSATIYAYGTNISGLPLVYGLSDGLAYIADTSSLPSTLSAITWDITTDTSTAWNATTSNSTSVGSFFITPGSSLGAVGFTSANTSEFAFPILISISASDGLWMDTVLSAC